MNESQNIGNRRPVYRNPQSGHRSRAGQKRRQSPQLHGRGYQTPGQRRRNAGGYQLQRHPINFAGRRGFANAIDPRTIIVLALVLVAVVLVVFNVVSCVSAPPKEETTVAAGTSDAVAQRLKSALDRDAQLKAIAAKADQYPEGLIDLALDEPDAVGFVAGYLNAEKKAGEAELSPAEGTVKALYTWNKAWGYADYAGQPFALTGSGPTAAAMAVMALTGSAEATPSAIAEAVTAAGLASGDSGTDASFFGDKADLGVAFTAIDLSKPIDTGSSNNASGDGAADEGMTDDGTTDGVDATSDGADGTTDDATADNGAEADAGASRLSAKDIGSRLSGVVNDGGYVLVQTSGGALGSKSHWVLVAAGQDGALQVFDPTSTQVTAHPWDPVTVASDVSAAISVKKAA